MAGTAAVIGSYLALVGPFSDAITQIINLAARVPRLENWHSVPSTTNQVNIGVGMYEGGAQDDFGGDGIEISGFTNQGTYVGQGKMPDMDQGHAYVASLDSEGSTVGDVQAWQLTLTAGGSNAVCISYVELVWQGAINSGFAGTWGQMCGQDWFYSSSTWGETEDKRPYRPACFWLDAADKHGKKDHPGQQMWANMESLISGASVPGSNTSTDTFCNIDVMKFSSTDNGYSKSPAVPAGLNKDEEGNGQPMRRRLRRSPPPPTPSSTALTSHAVPSSNVAQTQKVVFMSSNGTQAQLVVSDIQTHSATMLCNHPQSRGPDFISSMENVFCDMSAKMFYPLCDDGKAKDCFSLNKRGKRMSRRDHTTGQMDAFHRDYHDVQHWRE